MMNALCGPQSKFRTPYSSPPIFPSSPLSALLQLQPPFSFPFPVQHAHQIYQNKSSVNLTFLTFEVERKGAVVLRHAQQGCSAYHFPRQPRHGEHKTICY